MTRFISTKIELWPVEKLIPYDRNARTHSDEQIEQIARSIQEFGFTNPILVETGAGILAGHARLRGALRAGLPQVPVIVLDHITEVQKRAYILVDNKLALNAGWDDEPRNWPPSSRTVLILPSPASAMWNWLNFWLKTNTIRMTMPFPTPVPSR